MSRHHRRRFARARRQDRKAAPYVKAFLHALDRCAEAMKRTIAEVIDLLATIECERAYLEAKSRDPTQIDEEFRADQVNKPRIKKLVDANFKRFYAIRKPKGWRI